MLRELTREEMQRMGGTGDGNNGGDRDRDYSRSSYGAQANGFQPNWAAKGYGLFQDPCTGAVVTGAIAMAGALTSRNGSAIGTAAASAFVNIGSQCTKGSGNDRGVPFR
ncbi:hypothetical protein [Serratia marcescens]|uniref:hypothetical protein n=1 Tax=Serratia marcescens TaxID=615 RepID=UPI000F7DA87A|nr:hypothetical protein [Serratia marcescens]RTF41779.1 hypothetical protein D9B78_23745 [Serratia marcescens]